MDALVAQRENAERLGLRPNQLVEDWAEIRRLHRAERMPIRAIARHLGISRNTVKRALATDRPPKYERAAKGSAVDAVEVQIRELLRETPTMPAR
ncbi:helix-turn-helix domain-containing protein [Streptomyces sp. NPDC006430]|uniref:helix-turn-helix domain-containing protein n=1 Tax=Streptomyces sp. NPDC006430 TaxID=3154299 RepID=UPI0033B13264